MIFFEEQQNDRDIKLPQSPLKRRLKKKESKPDRFQSVPIQPNNPPPKDEGLNYQHIQPSLHKIKEPRRLPETQVKQIVEEHHQQQENTLLFDTEPLEQAQQTVSLEAQHDRSHSPRQEIPAPPSSNPQPTKRFNLFQCFIKEDKFAVKKKLLYTKCQSKQEYELVRVKESLATVYLLYAVDKNERLFLCATKKQVSFNNTTFEVSMHNELVQDIKGSELYVGHVMSSFTRDSFCFFQNYRLAEFDEARSCGSLTWERSFLQAPVAKLKLKYDNQGKNVKEYYSSQPTEKELFDMKHAWGITKSKKNIIMKPKGEKEGVVRATLLLGKNNEFKMTLIASEGVSSFQAFCFAVAHLTHLE